MRTTNRPILAYAFALSGAAIGLVAAGGAGFAHSLNQADATGCEVLANPSGGGFALEAVYHSEAAVQGDYRLSVRSAGGAGQTNINQGGGFSAGYGETLTLGRVTVGGAAAYDVNLTINLDGQAIECSKRIGVSI